jgi:hypothetical protein
MEERIKRGSKRTDRSGEIAMNIRLQTNAKETRADETRSDETRRVETSRNTKHETRDIEIWNDGVEAGRRSIKTTFNISISIKTSSEQARKRKEGDRS